MVGHMYIALLVRERGEGECVLGVTCASWKGKGGRSIGQYSTISEGYKAIQLIRQGEGESTVGRFWQVFSAVMRMFSFLLSFHFRSTYSDSFRFIYVSGCRFLLFRFHAKLPQNTLLCSKRNAKSITFSHVSNEG